MKKILFGLFLLNATPIFADSISTGTLSVVLPSTNTQDKNKSWGTKLNDGLQTIVTDLTAKTVQINSIASTTGTFVNKTDWNTAKSTTVNYTDWQTAKSTTVSASDWNTAKSTVVGFADWQTAKSTTVNYTDWQAAKSTTVNESNWNVAKNTTTSIADFNIANTTGPRNIGVALTALTTIQNYLTGGAVAIYSAGTFQGNATTLNFTSAITATCSGSTCTPTAAASSGGGGATIRNFDGVVIGTRGALSVDATIGSQADWITVLSSLGMAGLTTGTSAQGQIFLRNGVYSNWITTIPAGATILCQPSAVLVMNPLGGRSIFNYGKLGTTEWPCSLDGNSVAFTSTQTEFFSNSRGNIIIYGEQTQAAAFGSKIFVIFNSTGVVASVELKGSGYTDPNSVAYTNDRVPMLVRSSSECAITFKTGEYVPVGAGGIFSFEDMWHSQITFDAKQIGSYYMSHYGGGFNRINGKARMPSGLNEQNPNGFLVFDTIPLGPFYGASTSTILNMNIESYSTSNGVLIKIISGQSIGIMGTITEHALNNTQTGVSIGAGSTNCFTDSLYLQGLGTPVTDGGTNSTLNYWVNGKHPFNN